MATIPQLRDRLREAFTEKQADLLAHAFVEAYDNLVSRADFHELTAVLRELAEAQKGTEVRVEELADAQKRTEVRVEELAEAQKGTEVRVEELADAQKRTEVRVGELTDAQKHTEVAILDLIRSQQKMLIRLDRNDGRAFEQLLTRHLPAYVGRVFRRCRVIETAELVDSLEDRLPDADLADLSRADILATARDGDRQVHLVVEVSCTADADDIERASRRAAILARAGLAAIGIVACEAIEDRNRALAERAGVRVLLEGRFVSDAA
jgi:hypothetical protein